MSLLKPFLTISAFTLLSRVVGFARDIIMAAVLGAGPLMEIFVIAFKLPNFFRRLFGEGAFNAAFVPMYASTLANGGREEARRFSEKALSVLLVALIFFTLLMEWIMPWALYLLAPGFIGDKAKLAMATDLCRITFPYLILISLVSLLTGILNSVGKFSAGAFVPTLLNLCMIAALLIAGYVTATPAHVLSYALIAAGIMQLLWMIGAAARAGVLPHLKRPALSPDVKRLLKRMVPGIVGSSAVQINLWVDVLIGTMIPNAIAYLYYADRLSQLPLGLVGTAVGTAMLPLLSRQFSEKKIEAALATQNRAIELAMFFTLPAAAALLMIAYPLVSALFERGEFGALASRATAYALMAYAVGLPAFVLVKVLTPGFFANGDTKTPVQYGIVALIANIVFNVAFILLFKAIGWMPHIGIALATSLASWLNVALLWRRLERSRLFKAEERFARAMLKIITASGVLCFVLAVARIWGPDFSAISGKVRILALCLLIAAGALSYFIAALALRIIPPERMKQYLRRKR